MKNKGMRTGWRIDTFEAQADTDFMFGADWGFSRDPLALIRFWIELDKRQIYIDYENYGIGVEISDMPAFFDKVPQSRKWTIIADSENPVLISHMKTEGFKIKPVKKGAGSVEVGVKFLQDFEIIVHERCKNTIAELGTYQYVPHKLTEEATEKIQKGSDHVLDGLRYGTSPLHVAKSTAFPTLLVEY